MHAFQRESAATTLTSEHIHKLRSHAQETAGAFVDPRRMRHIESWWDPDLREWASAIVGEPVAALRSLSWPKWVLLDLAHDAEPSPPPPPEVTARREQQRLANERRALAEQAAWEAQTAAWSALRVELPVITSVAFNFSRHTYEFYNHSGYHIVVWANLHAGRFHRSTGQALCETPSRSHNLHLDNAKQERQAQEHGVDHTLPTCKTCLRTAYRLTGHPPDRDLLRPPERIESSRPQQIQE